MNQPSPQPIIELEGVDVARADQVQGTPILEGVTWSVQAGDFWTVGALPGRGKTDLLATAGGLQRPLRGTLRLFGQETSGMTEEELVANRLRVGMVFGAGRVFSQLTVGENVALPLRYHYDLSGEKLSAVVEQALSTTGLLPLANERAGLITRNLHQRVGLARALALKPEVLLVDNPLVAVDTREARWWLDLLCVLNKPETPEKTQPMTIIVGASDLRPWVETARQFAYIDGQHFHLAGGRNELKTFQQPIVQELLMPPMEVEF